MASIRVHPGDVIELEQADGEVLQILPHTDGVWVKTDDIGHEIVVKRDSSFLVMCHSIDTGAQP